MPIINVKMLSGRTVEQKRELVEVLTKETVRIINTQPQAVTVVIEEYEKENWGTGGVLSSDIGK